MRKDFGVKPSVYPEPVFILAAYDEDGTPQAMNAAWGGIRAANQIALCVNPGHKTVKALLASGAFTVSMGQADQAVACDYVGSVSGNNEPDKFAKSGFHATKSGVVNAPLIDELSYALECTVASYDEPSHVLIGEIKNISVDERVLDAEGKVDVDKLAPITFDGNNKKYYRLGECVGDAWSIGKSLK
ncbi:MAG: flavin reductase family protein [Peptococcaceae bacterium]|nr:flavin reductase family protein [Peptococcaceae bacterium]